jgi:hypothetical protein
MKLVYIAGPYMGKARHHDSRDYFEIDHNISIAKFYAAKLANEGIGFFCPHTHSEHFEVITPAVPPSFWYALDNELLKSCQAILLLPGFEDSKGSMAELSLAETLGLEVFVADEDPELLDLTHWAKS